MFRSNHRIKRTKSENSKWICASANAFNKFFMFLVRLLLFFVFFESEEITQRTRAQSVSCTLNGLSLGHPCTRVLCYLQIHTYTYRSGRPMKFNSFSLDIFSVRRKENALVAVLFAGNCFVVMQLNRDWLDCVQYSGIIMCIVT